MEKRSNIPPTDRIRAQADNRYRLVFQIESLVAEFIAQRFDLDRRIRAEEARPKQTDPTHYAYSAYAASLRGRVRNLDRSIIELIF